VPARASLTPSGELTTGGWSSGPVAVAVTFRDRWRGLRPAPAGCGLLLRARSVHAFGMKTDLLVVGIDSHGIVTDTRTLRPGRIVMLPAARFILELQGDRSPPMPGSVLTWQGAGPTDPLRHADRQSR
jgi:hypothetical protein